MQSHAVVFHGLFLLQTKENRKAAVLNSLMQIHFLHHFKNILTHSYSLSITFKLAFANYY